MCSVMANSICRRFIFLKELMLCATNNLTKVRKKQNDAGTSHNTKLFRVGDWKKINNTRISKQKSQLTKQLRKGQGSQKMRKQLLKADYSLSLNFIYFSDLRILGFVFGRGSVNDRLTCFLWRRCQEAGFSQSMIQ